MNDRTFEILTRDYLAEGPTTLGDHILEDALHEIHGRRQRRFGRFGRMVPSPARLVWLAAAAVIVVTLTSVWVAPLGSGGALSGSGRSIGPSFGSAAVIRDVWTTNDDVALTWEAQPTEQATPYLMAVIYDTFVIDHWAVGRSVNAARATNEDLLSDTGDAPPAEGRREMTMTIAPSIARSDLFFPTMPSRVDQETTVELLGDTGFLARVTRSSSRAPYTMTSLIPVDEADGGPTGSQLRVAGRDYPAEILELYGPDKVPAGSIITAEGQALATEIAAAGGGNPYDTARAAVRIFQDPDRFIYDTDVRDLACDDLSIVDCFAVYQRGYCEYYASTMAIILRELGIPTRVSYGFLPGEKDLASGVWTVRNSDAHAWVQVYFPGHGWIDFDPTGGGVATLISM